jgi:acetoin utilization deacetylase AcuC-like enzyme
VSPHSPTGEASPGEAVTVVAGLPVVVDDRHRQHDPPYELNAGRRVTPVHERPARLDAILDGLRAIGIEERAPGDHGDEVLDGVHDPAMVTYLREAYPAWRDAGGPEVMIADTFRSPRWAGGGRRPSSPLGALGWFCTDTATPVVAGSYVAARVAVDVACTAVDLVLDGADAAYGLTRPPGHHAGPDYFGGFCLLNHAAVAAQRLRAHGRVAIIDVDVHHGNGTQDVFWRDPQVLYLSVHTDPDHQYPYFSGYPDELGEGAGHGTTRNLPLPPGTGDDGVLAAVEVAGELADAFDPVAVVVSLGYDAAAADPLGQLAVTAAGYARLGALLGALDRPTVLLQEGGYALDHLGALAAGTLSAFVDARTG